MRVGGKQPMIENKQIMKENDPPTNELPKDGCKQ